MILTSLLLYQMTIKPVELIIEAPRIPAPVCVEYCGEPAYVLEVVGK